MANLIFTNNCNLDCPFCFATENQENSTYNIANYSYKEIMELMTFLPDDEIRLCGGEPTLNPIIDDIIRILLQNKKRIFIMTNGLWPKKFQDYIKNLPVPDQINIHYLFNILHPDRYKQDQFRNIQKSLSTINPINTALGFTIYKKDFQYEYLINLAKEYKIKYIRWSIAAPNISSTDYQLEKHFFSLAKNIKSFLFEVKKNQLNSLRDCGYLPLCFFEKQDLMDIMMEIGVSPKAYCRSSSIDIDQNGDCWRCYGLYSVLKTNYKNFKNHHGLRSYFDRRIKILDNMPSYSDCKSCNYWKISCDGGCYAIRIRRVLQQNPDMCLFPIDDNKEVLNCKPQRKKNIIVNKDDRLIYTHQRIIENIDDNTIEFLNEIDGEKDINYLIEKWKNNFSSYSVAKKTITEKCREMFERDLIEINYNYKCLPISVESISNQPIKIL